MKGGGKAAEVTDEMKVKLRNAITLSKPGLVPLTEQRRFRTFGPELGFSLKFFEEFPEEKLYIAKFAQNGMPLHHGWDAKQYIGGEPTEGRTNFYPGEYAEDPNIGSLYKKLIAAYTGIANALKDQGIQSELAGILWMQGEKDALKKVSSEAYAESLKRLKMRIQEDLGSGDVPFVFGQVLPHEGTERKYPYRSVIRQMMAEADHRSGSIQAVPNMWMVSTDNITLGNDNLHYNTEGQLMLGKAFAEIMLSAQD